MKNKHLKQSYINSGRQNLKSLKNCALVSCINFLKNPIDFADDLPKIVVFRISMYYNFAKFGQNEY